MRLVLLLALMLSGCAAHAGNLTLINSSPISDRYGWTSPFMPVEDGYPPSPIA